MPKQLIFELRLLNAELEVQQRERVRVTLNSGPLCAEVELPKIKKKLQERQEKRGWCNCKVQYLYEDRLLDFVDAGCLRQLLELYQEFLLRDTVELPLFLVPDPTDDTDDRTSSAIDGEDIVFELDQQGGPLKLSLQSDILLGKGGFGQVRRTRDKHAAYAMKIAFPDDESQRSLKTEIHTLLQLNHPNIIKVLKHGFVLDPVNGHLPAYMMDLCRCSVQALLDTGWHIQAAAVAVRRDVESALRHFHAAGLGHSDVKPGNILVSNKTQVPNGEIQLEVKLIDAGGAGKLGIERVKSYTPEYSHPVQQGLHTEWWQRQSTKMYAFFDWYSFDKTIFLAERLDSDSKRAGLTQSQILEEAKQTLTSNKQFVLETVRRDGRALQFACEDLRRDKEVVMEAVRQHGRALKFACPDLRSDKEVVMEAVRQHGYALRYACDDLQSDKEVVMEAVREHGYVLKFACEDLQRDKEVVMEALRQDGCALEFACEDLRRDKEVVMEAVRHHGWALKFACEDLRSDKEVVMEAVRQDGRALKFACEDLRRDKEVVMEAVRHQCSWPLRLACEDLRRDKEVVMEAVRQDGCALKFACEELQSDKEVVMEAVRQDGRALEFACPDLRSDKEVVMEAVRQHGYALKFACEDLQSDKEVVMEAVRHYGWALTFACPDLRSDKEVVMEAVRQHGRALQCACEDLRRDKEVIKSYSQ